MIIVGVRVYSHKIYNSKMLEFSFNEVQRLKSVHAYIHFCLFIGRICLKMTKNYSKVVLLKKNWTKSTELLLSIRTGRSSALSPLIYTPYQLQVSGVMSFYPGCFFSENGAWHVC